MAGFPNGSRKAHPVSADIPPAPGSGRVIAQPNDSLLWTSAEVMTRLAAGSGLLIDARTPERFRGETEPIDRIAGRIPGACNRCYKDNLRADQTMRPRAELRREFLELLGERSPGEVAHQCGSGVTACVNLLAMEHAGLAGSKLYAGSWSEWIADPARPIARGP